jgi:hypothetical protein
VRRASCSSVRRESNGSSGSSWSNGSNGMGALGVNGRREGCTRAGRATCFGGKRVDEQSQALLAFGFWLGLAVGFLFLEHGEMF